MKSTTTWIRRRTYRPLLERLETRLAPANVDVLSYHNDPLLTGANLQEEILTPANVNATDFGRLFTDKVDGYVYAQPLYKANLAIPNQGTHNVALVATEHDSIYALDADNPAAGTGPEGSLWKTSFINPANGITTVPAKDVGIVSTNIVPEVGITGTPVIDATTNTLYVVAKTKEVRADGAHYVQKLHALDLATGQEKFGGPATIGDTTASNVNTSPISVPGNGDNSVNGIVTFDARTELNRVALQLVNGTVYIGWASHEDARPYHGWVAGYQANNLAAGPVRWFNTAPNAGGVGIWQSGGAVSADAQGNLYFAVGNGFNGPDPAYDPNHGDYSESVVKLSATGQLSVVDYFTPYDWQTLDNQDADLGSGGAMLLPDYVGSTAHPHLMVETGKAGVIYLLDRDNLGKNSPDLATEQTKVVQRVVAGQAGVWGNPSFFRTGPNSGIIYYHGQGDVLKGYVIANGHIDDTASHILRSGFSSGYPGTQPVISANGIANPTSPTNGIVWDLQVDQYGNEGKPNSSAILRAFRANDFSTELYDSNQTSLRDQNGSAVKFTAPTVVNGHVLVGGQYSFTVFGLFPAATDVPAARTNLQGIGQASSQGPQILLTWTNPMSTTGTAPTGIKIFRSTDGTNFSLLATVSGRDASFTDLGPLTFGQQYSYRVVATNQRGDALPSNTVAVIAPIRSAVLTIASITSAALGLSWTSVANDHYDIERSTDGTNFTRVATVPATQTTYTDSGLTPGVYAYRIRAFSSNPSASSLSNVQGADVGATIDHGTDFSNTTDLTANGDAQFAENSIRLTAADLQTGSVFTSNRITIAKFTASFLVRLHEGTQPNYADGFTFVIQALAPTALGQGLGGLGYQGIGNSVAVKFGTFQYAGDPSNSSTGLVLNGAAPRGGVDTNPNNQGVLLNSQDTKQIDLTYDGTTLTETITDTMRNTTFTTSFMVNIPQTIGSDLAYVGFTGSTGSPGASSAWEIQDFKTLRFTSQAPLPGTPGNLRVASTGATEVDLAWGGNSYNETGFRIERSTDGLNFTTAGMSATTTFADTGLTRGTYFYRVRAVNANGTSDVSNTVEATVPASDPAPVITGITRSSFSVTLNGTLTLNVTFTDQEAADAHTAVISWGDGSMPSTLPLAPDVLRFSASHQYQGAALGNYSIQVKVQDDDGGSSTVNLTAATASVVPPDGLTDWWTGDGLNTTTAPDIAGTNPGTLVGGVTYATGKVGNAFRFNGSDGYVKLPDNSIPFPTTGNSSNAALSFTAWFATLSGGVIIGQQGGPAFGTNPNGWVPGVYVGTDGKLWAQMFWNGGVQAVSSPNTVNDGQFHFVAVSSNGTTESVYLDNRLIGTTSGVKVGYTNNYSYQIGTGYTAGQWQSVNGDWYSFQGLIDEVQIYNTALTPAAIQAVYNAGSAGQVKGVAVITAPPPVITSVTRSPNAIPENGMLTLSGTFIDPRPGSTHTVDVSWGDASPDTMLNLAAGVSSFSATHHYLEEPTTGTGYSIQVQLQNATGGTDLLDLSAGPAAATPPNGLVSWWTGDGANATAPDIAGSNPGTLNGGVTYAAGKVQNAFRFDGAATSYVNVPDAPSLNITTGATWDFWVKTTQAGSYVGLMGKHDAMVSYNGVTVFMDPSGFAAVQIKANPATTTLQGTTHINDGQFHHLAVTFLSGGAAVLYVDGQRQAADTAPAFSFNANPLRLGKLLDDFWMPLNGLLDEVQVFNRVLTAAEVQAIYQAGSAGQVKGAVVLDPAVAANGGYQVSAVAGAVSRIQTVATFTDPAGAEPLTDYSAVIDWGDHSTSPGMISGPNNGVFTIQGSHSYTQAGNFPITVTIKHDTAPDAVANSTAQVAAAVIHFLVTGFPSPTTAGDPGNFTVTALDQLNETLAGYRGTVGFSSSDGQALLPSNYAFTAADQGVHTFSATLKTAGTQAITVTDTTNGTFTGSQFGIVVTPGPTTTLLVTDFPSPVVAGSLGSVLVTAVDAFGNLTPAYRGTVHLTSTDPGAVLQGDHTFTAGDNGRTTFGVILVTAGTQAVTATDTANPALTGTQAGIQVNAAAAVTLTVSGYPSPARKKTFYDFTVTALDAYGNVVTGYTGTVTFSSDARRVALPADYTFTAADQGVHTFSAAFLKAGVFNLAATDTNDPTIAGVQADIQVVGRRGGGQDVPFTVGGAEAGFEKPVAHVGLRGPIWTGRSRDFHETEAVTESRTTADSLDTEGVHRFFLTYPVEDLRLGIDDIKGLLRVYFPA